MMRSAHILALRGGERNVLPNFPPSRVSSGLDSLDLGLAGVTAGWKQSPSNLAKFRHQWCGERVENIKRKCSHTCKNSDSKPNGWRLAGDVTALRIAVFGKELNIDGALKRSTFTFRVHTSAKMSWEVANDIAELNSPMEVSFRIRAVAERVMVQYGSSSGVCFVPVYEGRHRFILRFRIFVDIGPDLSSVLRNHSAPLHVPRS